MKKGWMSLLLPHLIAVIVFLVIAVVYCRPVLQGDVLNQSDIVQWKAMSKNSFDYKATHGHFPLWTNSMFSGMPAYQIAMEGKSIASPGIIQNILTLGMPKPISFFFLACLCFYFLTQVLRVNPYLGIIGALGYAYATYNTGIIEAGHDTKMQTIAFLPAFIASLMVLYERHYLLGTALTALFTALLIGANHMQIVYYSGIIAFFMTVGYLVRWIREKQYRHAGIAIALALVAGGIGLAADAVSLLTTKDAAKTTIRGGTELPDVNQTKTGLSQEYALSYSMYKTEPLVMLSPNIFGGSGGMIEEKVENSKALESLQSMPPQLANQLAGARAGYWGGLSAPGQVPPNVPPYAGAIICFLALIGFFILDNRHKWWILAATILSLMMSWGSYFEGFNVFLLKSLPLYNKFRVPSMILVIPTFLFGMMAMLTLQKVLMMDNREELWERYKKGLMLAGGIFVVLLLVYFSADFTSQSEKEISKQLASAPEQVKDYVQQFLKALQDDRRSLFMSSLGRSLFYMAVAALMVWLAIRNKLKSWIAFGILGVFAFIDIMSVDAKYLNKDNYKEETEYNQSYFTPSKADEEIMQDKGYYRVFDLRQGLTSAMPSYFHNSIGGYHPAKLSIYQDLIEHQLSKFPQSMNVVNMLNTKYFIQQDQQGKDLVIPNAGALGHCWFVKGVRFENDAQSVMNALSNFSPADTAVVFASGKNLVNYAPGAQAGDSIWLDKNDNDVATYHSRSAENRFAVFSEIYYDLGWKAYIDGKEAPIVRTNYVLRGVSIPAGQHEIRFVFHPDSFYTGETISSIAGVLIYLLLIGAIVQYIRKRRVKS